MTLTSRANSAHMPICTSASERDRPGRGRCAQPMGHPARCAVVGCQPYIAHAGMPYRTRSQGSAQRRPRPRLRHTVVPDQQLVRVVVVALPRRQAVAQRGELRVLRPCPSQKPPFGDAIALRTNTRKYKSAQIQVRANTRAPYKINRY